MQGLNLESLNEQQLDEVLDRLDPQIGELTPAGEEFIGSLIKKAKKAVKVVASTVKKVGGKIASVALGPGVQQAPGSDNAAAPPRVVVRDRSPSGRAPAGGTVAGEQVQSRGRSGGRGSSRTSRRCRPRISPTSKR